MSKDSPSGNTKPDIAERIAAAIVSDEVPTDDHLSEGEYGVCVGVLPDHMKRLSVLMSELWIENKTNTDNPDSKAVSAVFNACLRVHFPGKDPRLNVLILKKDGDFLEYKAN
jgi:hypothetical protein